MLVSIKLDDGAYLPDRAHSTDAGADIRTPVPVVVMPKGSAVVKTGVHIQLPSGTVGIIKSRSGLNVKHNITSEGVIDEGYTGEIVVKLYNHGNRCVAFERGDKVSQLMIVPVLYPSYIQVAEIAGGERGNNGFGSTGR